MNVLQKYKVVLLHDIDEDIDDATYKKGSFGVAQLMPHGDIYLGPWRGEEDLKNRNGHVIFVDAFEGVDFDFVKE